MDAVGAVPEPTIIRPPSRWIGLGLPELWRYRELLLFFAWRDLKVRYKQTLLGIAWAVLQPLLYMVVFTLFFGRLAGISGQGKPYALFALAGSAIWLYFANTLNVAANSLVGNAALIGKVYFPRLLAPLAPVIAGLVDLVLAVGVLLVVMGAYGYAPDAARIWALFPFALLTMATAAGVGTLLAAVNVRYRDVRYVVPFLIQLWLFTSPVVYSSHELGRPWRTLYYANPMAGAVEGFRWALLGGPHPTAGQLALSAGVGALLLVGGAFYFRRTERYVADII